MKFFSATAAILLISVAISGLLTPQSARAEGLAQEEYIKVEVRGKLNNEIMAIGGETTGVVITANGVTWELDFSSTPAFRKKSQPMNGKMVVVKGKLSVKQGVEIRKRWIVKVESIQADNGQPALSILDTKRDDVKKLEVSQTFGGFRETQIFYTFPTKNVILKIRIDNKNKDFGVTGKVIVFPKETTADGLGKWLNNQHSDGLYPDIPQPISTLDLPTKLCSSSNPKFTDKTETRLGNFDNYSIEFKVSDIEQIGNFQIRGFSGKAMVHLKIN